MRDLATLIPGFYADHEDHLYVDMGMFLAMHGIPDAPAVRRVVWEEIRDVFAGLEVREILD